MAHRASNLQRNVALGSHTASSSFNLFERSSSILNWEMGLFFCYFVFFFLVLVFYVSKAEKSNELQIPGYLLVFTENEHAASTCFCSIGLSDLHNQSQFYSINSKVSSSLRIMKFNPTGASMLVLTREYLKESEWAAGES